MPRVERVQVGDPGLDALLDEQAAILDEVAACLEGERWDAIPELWELEAAVSRRIDNWRVQSV